MLCPSSLVGCWTSQAWDQHKPLQQGSLIQVVHPPSHPQYLGLSIAALCTGAGHNGCNTVQHPSSSALETIRSQQQAQQLLCLYIVVSMFKSSCTCFVMAMSVFKLAVSGLLQSLVQFPGVSWWQWCPVPLYRSPTAPPAESSRRQVLNNPHILFGVVGKHCKNVVQECLARPLLLNTLQEVLAQSPAACLPLLYSVNTCRCWRSTQVAPYTSCSSSSDRQGSSSSHSSSSHCSRSSSRCYSCSRYRSSSHSTAVQQQSRTAVQ